MQWRHRRRRVLLQIVEGVVVGCGRIELRIRGRLARARGRSGRGMPGWSVEALSREGRGLWEVDCVEIECISTRERVDARALDSKRLRGECTRGGVSSPSSSETRRHSPWSNASFLSSFWPSRMCMMTRKSAKNCPPLKTASLPPSGANSRRACAFRSS